MQCNKLTLPNCMTLLRIVLTALLLPVSAGTGLFYGLYTLAGLTDGLDGWLARRLGQCSALGAKLDSAADLLFYGVMLTKFFPLLFAALPQQILYAVAATVLLRLGAYLTAALKFRRFASPHTVMNKLSGLAVFAVPYLYALPWGGAYCWCVCAVTLAAAAGELTFYLRGVALQDG